MIVFLAFALFLITLLTHYGYYLIAGVPVRLFYAFSGMHELILCAVCTSLMFKRVHDWRAAMFIWLSLVITVVENAMVAVCGSWYAFVYQGPALQGDRCELMTGYSVSKPLTYTVLTLTAIVIPQIWHKARKLTERHHARAR